MPDYGHDLLFGSFITPDARNPEQVLRLAEATEAAGLDLATFQDHPYNAGFLDTWTLLSWVAARTQRIHVSANVLNLPLRGPGVIARSAASLDVLSGGRFELGLGAGALWDQIAAMGGPARTPGEAVEALGEAIDVLRGVWDTDTPGALRVEGKHYGVRKMQRGPRPPHPIGIWVGAHRPRMLRLVGRKADGWLPTLEALPPADQRDSNRAIDEAALAAGRSPGDVWRLLNVMRPRFATRDEGPLQGPTDQWVEELAELALVHGFSAFLFGGDDGDAYRRIAEEVAPAVRELVAKERARTGVAGGPRGGASGPAGEAAGGSSEAGGAASEAGGAATVIRLTRAHDGIDCDALPSSLRHRLIVPDNPAYDAVRHSYQYRGAPALVIQPESANEVIDALAFARAQPVTLSVRSGGHGLSGRSTNDGGIVIDLAKLNRVELLDRDTRRVRVEAGARWGEVAEILKPHGLAISSGDWGNVGAGGLATTGGIGYMARMHGLTIDHVVAVEVVTADGRFLRADAQNHPDLFWAMRGAGANFGIATAFELIADEVGDVVFTTLQADATETAELIKRWAATVEASPREISSFLAVFPGQPGAPPIASATIVYAGDDVEAAERAIGPFLAIGPVINVDANLMPYAATVRPSRVRHNGSGLSEMHSGLIEHVTDEIADLLAEMIASEEIVIVQFRTVGGAVNDVAPDATAYAHRTQNFSLLASTHTPVKDTLDRHWEQLRPHLNGMYLSFEIGASPERVHDAFPEPTLARLRALKAVYDPDDIFDKNFNILPAEADPAEGEGEIAA